MFRNLKKKTEKNSIENKSKKRVFSSCLTFVFDQNLFITLVS